MARMRRHRSPWAGSWNETYRKKEWIAARRVFRLLADVATFLLEVIQEVADEGGTQVFERQL